MHVIERVIRASFFRRLLLYAGCALLLGLVVSRWRCKTSDGLSPTAWDARQRGRAESGRAVARRLFDGVQTAARVPPTAPIIAAVRGSRHESVRLGGLHSLSGESMHARACGPGWLQFDMPPSYNVQTQYAWLTADAIVLVSVVTWSDAGSIFSWGDAPRPDVRVRRDTLPLRDVTSVTYHGARVSEDGGGVLFFAMPTIIQTVSVDSSDANGASAFARRARALIGQDTIDLSDYRPTTRAPITGKQAR